MTFTERLKEKQRLKNIESLTDEQKKERELTLIAELLGEVKSKKNRYIFYCPDLPIPLQTLRTIYQTASALKSLGYNSYVLHEMKGFKAEWLNEDYDVNFLYIDSDKKGKKYTFPFKPNDTFIVPDGFIGIMESVAENYALNKIVYLHSYEGLATIKENTWDRLGFNKVISVNKQLLDDYKNCFPQLDYYYLPFYIDENIERFKNEETKPVITLFSRTKKEASQLINIFYNKYGFLDVFNFKVIRSLNSDEYYKSISESCLMVLMDSDAGCMVPPLEASYFGVPILMFEGRNMEHLNYYKKNIILCPRDIFFITERLAEWCLNWLETNEKKVPIKDKEYVKDNFLKKINIFEQIQQEQEQKFNNILNAKNNEKDRV